MSQVFQQMVNESKDLAFEILTTISGDRIEVNDEEFEVIGPAYLKANPSDDDSPTNPDIYGRYVKNADDEKYRIQIKPDLSDSDVYVKNIEIWQLSLLGGSYEGDVKSFEIIQKSKGERLDPEKFKEIWEEEREQKREI